MEQIRGKGGTRADQRFNKRPAAAAAAGFINEFDFCCPIHNSIHTPFAIMSIILPSQSMLLAISIGVFCFFCHFPAQILAVIQAWEVVSSPVRMAFPTSSFNNNNGLGFAGNSAGVKNVPFVRNTSFPNASLNAPRRVQSLSAAALSSNGRLQSVGGPSEEERKKNMELARKLVVNPNAASNPYHLPVQEALIEYFASVLDESDRILEEAGKLKELNENNKYEALTAEQQKALKAILGVGKRNKAIIAQNSRDLEQKLMVGPLLQTMTGFNKEGEKTKIQESANIASQWVKTAKRMLLGETKED